MKHSHYKKDVSHLAFIDPYRIADLYGIGGGPLEHAHKKILCSGIRGVKNRAQDVQEAIDSLVRWQEMQAEDCPTEPGDDPVQWPEDEGRMDVIGQNGNGGEHYERVVVPLQCECGRCGAIYPIRDAARHSVACNGGVSVSDLEHFRERCICSQFEVVGSCSICGKGY